MPLRHATVMPKLMQTRNEFLWCLKDIRLKMYRIPEPLQIEKGRQGRRPSADLLKRCGSGVGCLEVGCRVQGLFDVKVSDFWRTSSHKDYSG